MRSSARHSALTVLLAGVCLSACETEGSPTTEEPSPCSGTAELADIAQHSAGVTGDFVIVPVDGGRVYEVDPRRLAEPECRQASIPAELVALAPNLYDSSVLGLTGTGRLFRATSAGDWTAWNEVGAVPASVPFVDLAQHSGGPTGDFVIMPASGGQICEADPRRLNQPECRPSNAPPGIVAISPSAFDSSMLAVTGDGRVFRAVTTDDWATWTQVGTVPGSSPFVDIVQHSSGPTGDFVLITGGGGEVCEIDPRRLNQPECRASSAPLGLVALSSNRYDDSMLAITAAGRLFRAVTTDDWVNWTEVGMVPSRR
jgi:hypothetical protein